MYHTHEVGGSSPSAPTPAPMMGLVFFYVQHSFQPFFGARQLEVVAELPVAVSAYGPIVVYRVR